MRQALWILRKDVRHLWPYAAVVWVLTAAYAVGEAALPSHPASAILPEYGVPLWLAMCFLVIGSICPVSA